MDIVHLETDYQNDNTAGSVSARDDDVDIAAIAQWAAKRVAPLWPLTKFVAVNPFQGLADQPFERVAHNCEAGGNLLMQLQYYRDAVTSGRVEERHLKQAAKLVGHAGSFDRGKLLLTLRQPSRKSHRPLITFADFLSAEGGEDWSAFVVEQFSFWAAGYFDQGQAVWRQPWQGEQPLAAWRSQAALDRAPEFMGVEGFRASAATLPNEPHELLRLVLTRLKVREPQTGFYFTALLRSIKGWASYARQVSWNDELAGGIPDTAMQLLAIRAAYDLILFENCAKEDARADWLDDLNLLADDKADDPSKDAALLVQTALELAYQEELVMRLETAAADKPEGQERPVAQAVFCIDVRSERLRRALEAVNPEVETVGFAGFFGVPMSINRIGETNPQAQCPVLLNPAYRIEECAGHQHAAAVQSVSKRSAFVGSWKHFKNNAVSSLAFVEAFGAGFIGSIMRELTLRPPQVSAPLRGVTLHPEEAGDVSSGITLEQRVELAQGMLAGMGLKRGLARVVALIGHGSTTTNNPYASSLDCGACGGHAGDANARVAAAILNDNDVRAALAEDGINIPHDTTFVAGLHDTTTDEVNLLTDAAASAGHDQDLAHLQRDLIDAGIMTRRERAQALGRPLSASIHAEVQRRSSDWSEVRPEWGLAGCAAFIAAPREVSRGADLGGRAFLHNYDWRDDSDNSILELIMTAPLVVASWISLQYYASTVDNDNFGSGDKTLHNVVGGIGVLEGAGGDLRGGLPLQSVHDGKNVVHEPLRLTAVIAAPRERINAVLANHQHVRDLFDRGWLNLIAIEGDAYWRYLGDMQWAECAREAVPASDQAA